jgi:hypothetical protein
MSSWQRWALNRPLNWWLSPIAIQIHTHCAGCGGRLSRPTHGPGFCQSCNAPKLFENLGHIASKSGGVRCNTGDAITTSIQE